MVQHTTPAAGLLLTAADAARTLAISQRSLWARTASGEIPHVRIGRSVRYRARSLEEYVAAKEEQGGQNSLDSASPPR